MDPNPPKARLPGKGESQPAVGEGGCPFKPGRVRDDLVLRARCKSIKTASVPAIWGDQSHRKIPPNLGMVATDPISEAWRTAALELGIRVEFPETVVIQGESVECAAFLPDFGSPNGTALFVLADLILPERNDTEPFYSLLSRRYYSRFSREGFIAALNDWGWYGDGEPPVWFSGYRRPE